MRNLDCISNECMYRYMGNEEESVFDFHTLRVYDDHRGGYELVILQILVMSTIYQVMLKIFGSF